MTRSINLIPSGFPFLDKKWGGIYRGGSYLVIGPRKSGRTLLALQFASECAKASEVCLYFTNMRPKDLMIQAASLNFDIQSYMNHNLLVVVRIAPPNEIYEVPNPDDYLAEYLHDIVAVANQYKPNRIVFDELTPYIGFRNVDYLNDVFLRTLEEIEDRNINSFFIVGEPATQKAQLIVDTLRHAVTGSILLKKKAEQVAGQYYGGTVIISPNVGHTEGQFTADYIIEPYKGISVEPTIMKTFTRTDAETEEKLPELSKIFKPITRIKQETPDDSQMSFSNIYSIEDFHLIINNQIALFKSTGQEFHLVSLRLDSSAILKGLITLNQLKNTVGKSVQRKDKICVVENTILVLIAKTNSQLLNDLIKKIRQNLPSKDEVYVNAVTELIKIYTLEISNSFNNSSELIELILSEEAANAHITLSELT
jgi:circadian clock protein KaiC